MRSTYHLIMPGDEYDKLVDVLERLKRHNNIDVAHFSQITTDSKEQIADVVISLSKYELLYVRLTVNIREIIEVVDGKPVETCS